MSNETRVISKNKSGKKYARNAAKALLAGLILLLTIIIEMPIVYNVLKSNVQSKRMLQITIIVSNIITTAGVAVIERLITEGHW